MMKIVNSRWLLRTMAIALIVLSCKEDEPEPAKEVIASFQVEKDATDFAKVSFKNFSQNFVSLSWNFGDGTATSSEENPVHTYAAGGTFTVKLTATGADGKTAEKTEDVTISDPDSEVKKLTGETSKSWKLLRDVSDGQFPLEVGPANRSQIWWALGRDQEVGARPCLMNDEFIFNLDGSYEYNSNDDFWADAGVWSGDPGCRGSEAANFENVDGVDISAWGDGTHEFEFNAESKELKVTGNGAFIALPKAATAAEVKTPQSSVTYKVVSLVDADVDTLILETTIPDGYWRFVLVHYDNEADEPEVPGAKPAVGFNSVIDGTEVTFTNTTSGDGITYSWDFGDGATSTEASPVHNYAGDGSYDVTLTATNSVGSSTSTQQIVISSTVLTEALLRGDGSKTWKIKPVAGAFKVGPAKSSNEWFDAGNVAETRACLANDEFIFKSSGVFEYDAKGDIYGEPYMGVDPAGCIDETALPAAAAAWGSGEHTFTFTPATADAPAYITVTGTGAFIALPKAHNGGEYSTPAPAADGSVKYEVLSYVNDGDTETLIITIDISAGEAGTGYWTFTLVSE
jgi:PKD repeat protein